MTDSPGADGATVGRSDEAGGAALSALVDAATDVAATRSRKAKTATIAALLGSTRPDEAPTAIGLLLGKPRQGRTGVGPRTLFAARPEPADSPSLSVAEVDALLDRLAATLGSGAGASAARTAVLAELFGRATSDEQDFLTRTLLGEVRTGALEGVLLDAIASAADIDPATVRRAAMLTGDLGTTARRALAGDDLATIGLTVGVPVLPMLASTAATPAAAVDDLGPASVEAKLDGARIQVHRRDGRIAAYTRTLADVTARIPEVVDLVDGFPGGDLILDGETILLDEDGRARPFAETMSRFGSGSGAESRLSAFFFDILHDDGRDLVDEPLRVRRECLRRIVGRAVVPGTITDDPDVADDFFAHAIADGHEGVVVKSLDSAYAAGRRGSDWIKVKPVHTLDLVVLGVERGSGRRTGMLSNLHLGARDPDGAFGPAGGVVMVGKTFKGLTDETLRWQTEYFPTIATEEHRWGLTLAPSTVVEIGFDGVQRSTRYPGGVALRFARVKRYRTGAHAKPADEADTIDTLRRMLR